MNRLGRSINIAVLQFRQFGRPSARVRNISIFGTAVAVSKLAGALLLSFLLLAPAGTLYAQGDSITDSSRQVRNGIFVELDGRQSEPFVVELEVRGEPLYPAPDLRIIWDLPEGGQLVGGAPAQDLGPVADGEVAASQRSVRFPGPGTFQIGAAATYHAAPSIQYAAAGVLFAIVDEQGAIDLALLDPRAKSPMHSIMETSVTTESTQVSSAEATDDPCFNVTGSVTRIERTPTQSGYAADVRVPVANAIVKMREEDIVFDDTYGEKVTNVNGEFNFSFCDDDGWFDDELELYVELRAELLAFGDISVVEVEDSSWIDEVYEYRSTIIESQGGSHAFNLALNLEQSAVFNIADAVWDAWTFWNAAGGAAGDDIRFDGAAEVHWEPGYGDERSFYIGYSLEEMTIADDPSDPDQWDDSVIIHEWAHMADDFYGCDDSLGGIHNVGQLVADPELAWTEGYPDYYQSAVRQDAGRTDGRFYLDNIGVSTTKIVIDLEASASSVNPMLASPRYEFAIAGMLWDFIDSANDGQDRVNHGHRMLQQVYTDPQFESNGNVWDDECTVNQYLLAWRQLNRPTDTDTAATVTQNIGLANPFSAAASQVAAASTDQIEAASVGEVAGAPLTPEDYKWWRQLVMVADNSASMVGGKFDAVKVVMNEQINDLPADPKGIEFSLYTFNNISAGSQEEKRGLFYPELITPDINSLTTIPDNDPNCAVKSFEALSEAVRDKRRGEAWIYTDGDSSTSDFSVDTMKQRLNEQQLRASIVLLGGCGSAPGEPQKVSGAATTYLKLAANSSQPTGIVPYLLTAIGSGGNFLFVDQTKLEFAAEILRAQLGNSAGAGRWSDYVSTSDTYIYDRLTSWEYQWQNATTNQGSPSDGRVNVELPQPFPFYAGAYRYAHVDKDGLIRIAPFAIGSKFDEVPENRRYLNILNGPLDWLIQPTAASVDAPEAGGFQVNVYSAETPDWFVITTGGTTFDNKPREYQALLHNETGEVRFQYKAIKSADVANAIIGLSPGALGGSSLVVSNKDVNGASNGMGYKFVPAPAQPTKTYSVTADAHMSAIGFLQTGFSGSFAPLQVRDPDGNPANCADTANVLCLDLGLVQYVQVDVDGRFGEWTATVAAGLSGVGTFAFTAMAASAISPESLGSRFLASAGQVPLRLNLGVVSDDSQLTAWLQQPDGLPFGAPFTLHDDGAHGDDQPDDGIFGLPDFSPPGAGAGYLWVKGMSQGAEFTRADPVPYNFQPIQVTGPESVANVGGATLVPYTITNLDNVDHCYERTTQIPPGWAFDWNLSPQEQNDGLCIQAGQSANRSLTVTPDGGMMPGEWGDVGVAFLERERGAIVDSVSTRLNRHGAVHSVQIANPATSIEIRPNGSDAVTLTVVVLDDMALPVANGTDVNMSATLGTVAPLVGQTVDGFVTVLFTVGTATGDAVVMAESGGATDSTIIRIREPLPDALRLQADKTDLSGLDSTNLVLAISDRWGDPVAGAQVRLGAEGDGQLGTIDGTQVVSGTTDSQGIFTATFEKVKDAFGPIGVHGQLLFDQENGDGLTIVAEERITLDLGKQSSFPVFLPSISK